MCRKAGRKDGPPPGRRLRVAFDAAAGGQLGCCVTDLDHKGFESDVGSPEGGLFFWPHGPVGTEVDHQPPPRPHGVGERVDLLDGGRRALPGLLAAGAPDPAGIAADQLVVGRCLHDGLEKTIGLGDGLRTGGSQALDPPGAHRRRRDGVQDHRGECGEQMQAQEPAVQLLRGDGKAALLDPLRGVRPEVDRARVGVNPVLALDVGLGEREPCLGLGACLESLRGGATAPIWSPVARLPPPGRELTNGVEFTPLRLAGGHQAVGRVLQGRHQRRTRVPDPGDRRADAPSAARQSPSTTRTPYPVRCAATPNSTTPTPSTHPSRAPN